VFHIDTVEAHKKKHIKLEIMGGKKKFHLKAEN